MPMILGNLEPYGCECESGVYRVVQALSIEHAVERIKIDYRDSIRTVKKIV